MAEPSTRAAVILQLRDRMTGGMKRVAAGLDRMAVKAQRAGLAMGAGAAILGMGIAKTLSSAVALDDNMRKVAARANGIDGAGLEKLRVEAKRLGRETSFTTAQVSELMGTLAQAGLNGGEIKAQTETMLNFARANGIAADAAAEYALSAASAYGIDKNDTAGVEHVTDVMTFAAQNSFQSVEDIGEAFKMVAPIANQTGQSIETVAASLAWLANMGIKGSNSGRQMKNVLLRMGKSGGEVAERLGVSFMDAAGNMKQLPELLGDFTKKTENMGNVEKMKLFDEAFGKIGLNAAMLGGDGADQITKFGEKLEELGGLTKKTANMMDGGIGGVLRKLYSALDGIVIAIGESMIPIVETLGVVFTTVANVITPFIADMKTLGAWILGVFTALAGGAVILLTMAGVATVVSTIVSMVAGLVSGFMAVLSFIVGISFPAIAIGIAIAAIVALVLLWVDYMWGISNIFDSLSETAGNLFDTLGAGFSGIKDAILAGELELAWDIAMQTMLVSFLQFMDMFGSGWRDTINWMVDLLFGFVNGFNDAWGKIVDGISSAIITIGNLLGFLDDGVAVQMQAELDTIRQEKKEAAQQSIDDLKDMIGGAVNTTTDQAIADLEVLTDLAAQKLADKEAADQAAADAKKNIKPWWEKAADAAVAAAQKASDYAKEQFDKHFEMAEVTTKTTSGAMGAFSAASLASGLNKDMKALAEDQLTETVKTNRILQKKSKGVWY